MRIIGNENELSNTLRIKQKEKKQICWRLVELENYVSLNLPAN